MKAAKTELILFSPDYAILETLRQFSEDLPYIEYEGGYGPEVVEKARLDAIWATPMMAVELFGANPPFPVHEARVLRTSASALRRGMPKYAVVGVATTAKDPKTPEFNLRLVLSALLRAVKDFNLQHDDQIIRIGILPENLALIELDPRKAINIVREVYEQS